jgi:hypothetical protein
LSYSTVLSTPSIRRASPTWVDGKPVFRSSDQEESGGQNVGVASSVR